ncbi:protein-export chaperone SecB [Bordetella pertussis]
MADQDQTNQQAGSDAPSFNLQRVYLKDLSLEMPNAPHVFWNRKRRKSRSASTWAASAWPRPCSSRP